MYVYLLLPFVYHFVPLFASGTPTKNLAEEISVRDVYGAPVKIILQQEEANWDTQYGGIPWEWNAVESGKYPAKGINPLPESIEGVPPEAFPNLEISKSIELVYDPKAEVFLPVMEISKNSQAGGKNSQRSSLLLLSSSTQKSLHKIFEKFEKETKGGGGTDSAKNYQTGRFKLYFRKGGGSAVPGALPG